MNLIFKYKYKSLTPFEVSDLPNFVVITGTNGSGKSQLLDLIYRTVSGIQGVPPIEVQMDGKQVRGDEVTFLQGEWNLQNTNAISLNTIHNEIGQWYSTFRSGNNFRVVNPQQIRTTFAYRDILERTKKTARQISREEFEKFFLETVYDSEQQLSQKIGQIFYNYRLQEIDSIVAGESPEEIRAKFGERPWVVMRDIIRESKLPFDFSDPSQVKVKESYRFALKSQLTDEEVLFSDLSSGERVLLSLVFYLFNSQERNVFPKLLLMDEPDAHLHPSMTQQFLNVIKNVLVNKYDIQVIMTTHSPSTVVLSPEESIYEMSREEPRIRKCVSKNHAVTLLTAGLVYVGLGTKYYLVEDQDDVDFYNHVYGQLVMEGKIDTSIPIVFMPASTRSVAGGNKQVEGWVTKLQNSGLTGVIMGVIDKDAGNAAFPGLFLLPRYSIENYFADPLVLFAALVELEKPLTVPDVDIKLGEEYKIRQLSQDQLQKISNVIFSLIEPELVKVFSDFDLATETIRQEIDFSNGIKLLYPKWVFTRRGKTLLGRIYNPVFGAAINFDSLSKAFRKVNLFPDDLMEMFNKLKENV